MAESVPVGAGAAPNPAVEDLDSSFDGQSEFRDSEEEAMCTTLEATFPDFWFLVPPPPVDCRSASEGLRNFVKISFLGVSAKFFWDPDSRSSRVHAIVPLVPSREQWGFSDEGGKGIIFNKKTC